jgi:hypothetical protein
VVIVTRIDRLARSTFDLFGIVKRIVDAKAQFRSLAEPWADTGTSAGRLMLAVLGGLAGLLAIVAFARTSLLGKGSSRTARVEACKADVQPITTVIVLDDEVAAEQLQACAAVLDLCDVRRVSTIVTRTDRG